jgi:hypothetical protein
MLELSFALPKTQRARQNKRERLAKTPAAEDKPTTSDNGV